MSRSSKVRFVSEEAINGAISIMLYDARTLNAEKNDENLGMTLFSAIVHSCRERGYTPIVLRKGRKNVSKIPKNQE